MNEHRKLAAIMFTDIVGYTSLMSKDEKKALDYLHKNRDIVKLLVGQFNGEFLESIGDGTLSTFNSVVDAVNCALEIQNTLKGEAELKLRIGIHLGDVIVEDGAVFGDGVNVASRIQNLAEAGGVCISERVYYDIKNKPVLEAIFLGEKKLKNVDDPVKVYSLTRGGESKPKIALADTKQLSGRQQKKKPWPWVLVGAVVVVFVVGGYVVYQRSVQEQVETQQFKSIAVLPLRDNSQEKDQGHICDGIAEDINSALTVIEGIDVLAHTSAIIAREKGYDISEIGELNVETVLEGSLQREGDMLRIKTQLIKVSDGFQLWSQTYYRELESIFDIQEDIAMAIVEELKGKLLGKEKTVIAKRSTDNSEAYELYLKGHPRVCMGRGGPGLAEDIRYFEMAIQKDPDFAEAYLGLAFKYNWMGYNNLIPPREAYPKAKEAIQKALEIDSSLAEAYTQLAWTNLYYDWDLPEAEKNFKHALELNPQSYLATRWYKDYFMATGDFQKALELIKKARELDPLATSLGQIAANAVYAGNLDEARELLLQAREIDPDHPWINSAERRLYLRLGDYEKVLEVTKRMNDDPDSWMHGLIYAKMGEKEKAEEILRKCIQLSREGNFSALGIARLYLELGNYDKTFEWLDRAYEKRKSGLIYINSFYFWEPIRSDPRFKALLRKMGLPED